MNLKIITFEVPISIDNTQVAVGAWFNPINTYLSPVIHRHQPLFGSNLQKYPIRKERLFFQETCARVTRELEMGRRRLQVYNNCSCEFNLVPSVVVILRLPYTCACVIK